MKVRSPHGPASRVDCNTDRIGSRALTAFVVWFVAIQPLQAEEGCPFLSNAEVEELTGRKLELFKLTSMTLPDGAGTLCDSEIARVVVLFGENSASRLDDMMKEFGRERGAIRLRDAPFLEARVADSQVRFLVEDEVP